MGHYFSTPPPPKPEIDIFTLVIYFYLGLDKCENKLYNECNGRGVSTPNKPDK